MPFSKRMPLWGPYSKKYMGVSRVIESLSDIGARFDVSVHPTLWNSATPVPNVTVPSNYHLWECAADYSYFAYRYELMWKDMVYADVSFSKLTDEAFLIRCEFHNNTKLTQNCIFNLNSALEFPFTEYTDVVAPEKSIVLNANDYTLFEYAVKRPWDSENPDGMFKGMFRDKAFYLSCGLGDRCDHKHVEFMNLKPFGCEAGDRVEYKLTSKGFENPVLHIRYRTVTDGNAEFLYNGEKITLKNSDALTFVRLPFKDNPTFESLGGAGIELDFLAVTESGESVDVETKKYGFIPKIETENTERGGKVNLDYGYEGCRFTVLTHNKNTRFRTLNSGSLEDALINRLSNGDHNFDDLKETFSASFNRKSSDEGFFQNTLVRSVFIEPKSSHIEYAVIAKGDFEPLSDNEYEAVYQSARKKADKVSYNKAGERYKLSTGILRATLLTNAVYPVYRHGENVIHHTPGKRWDSFYTWDSGFVGMGLLEFSPELCRYALDLYLSEEDNKDFAFLLHGSLVPTQFVQYLELIKRCENKSALDYLYPKLKRYYEFLRGREGSSTCAKFGNGLLTTYDYWYSCSGMDDYPAQWEMIDNKREEYACPVLPTAQIIRAAKIMKMTASYLGKTEDIAVYDSDIAQSENALNTIAWDEESGYFGYTLYDKGEPYIMKTENGENWDKGFDGVYPLISGSVKGERRKRLIEHIQNPDEMWSAAGISAVDMTASYYHEDGYWNGNVWMSHQWFAWKTMLDNGEADFAFAVADRALEMWKEETDFSYNTYECFGIKTRRGGWFHNFGGLSAPICIWANAYYKAGTVTTGFDVWTDYQRVTTDGAELKFRYFGDSEKYTILVTLSDNYSYSVTLDGAEIECNERSAGCLEITLDGRIKDGIIKIVKKS